MAQLPNYPNCEDRYSRVSLRWTHGEIIRHFANFPKSAGRRPKATTTPRMRAGVTCAPRCERVTVEQFAVLEANASVRTGGAPSQVVDCRD